MQNTNEFEVRASAKFVRIAPRKLRMVADMVRGRKVSEALELLSFSKKGSAKVIKRILSSAVASATEQNLGDVDNLVVSKVMVDKGPNNRRWRPRAMGRATRINKFTSHIHLFVADQARS